MAIFSLSAPFIASVYLFHACKRIQLLNREQLAISPLKLARALLRWLSCQSSWPRAIFQLIPLLVIFAIHELQFGQQLLQFARSLFLHFVHLLLLLLNLFVNESNILDGQVALILLAFQP